MNEKIAADEYFQKKIKSFSGYALINQHIYELSKDEIVRFQIYGGDKSHHVTI